MGGLYICFGQSREMAEAVLRAVADQLFTIAERGRQPKRSGQSLVEKFFGWPPGTRGAGPVVGRRAVSKGATGGVLPRGRQC
jgi:hypothetical protein